MALQHIPGGRAWLTSRVSTASSAPWNPASRHSRHFAKPILKPHRNGHAKYDGIVFEMEHNPWDIRALRDSLQYMLNRGQIVKSGSFAPGVVPMVRIPPNGSEKAQFHAKQALDLGSMASFGRTSPRSRKPITRLPHAATRGARIWRTMSRPHPRRRADRAVRYWGLSQQEYYDRADVWPLSLR